MKKYTFEDWQNDKIDYRIPGGQNILEAQNGLVTLYKCEKLISKEDYEQINKCQLTAYNTAVELTVKSYIKNLQETYDGSHYKTEYLNNEIRITQELIDKDLNQKNNVLAGLKDWSCIKGGEHQKIMKEKDLFDNEKFKFSGWALNNNMRITTLYKYFQWLIEFQEQEGSRTGPDKQPNTKRLKNELKKYGFYDLTKVRELRENSDKLIQLLSDNELPYRAAMLDYLGFPKYLKKEHCNSQKELYELLSNILNSNNRAIKGNILVLNDSSKENKNRYTAHLHKETVQTDYQKLK